MNRQGRARNVMPIALDLAEWITAVDDDALAAAPRMAVDQVRHATRGLSREECQRLIGHLAIILRTQALAAPADRRAAIFDEWRVVDAIRSGEQGRR